MKAGIATARADVLLYVQHLLGIGHLRRAAVLSQALTAAGLRVVFVTGGRPAPEVNIVASELVQLPPARVVDESFALVDDAGAPTTPAWEAARCAQLLDTFRRCRPRCLLIELFPFGRRQMRFELLPLLTLAQETRPRPWIVTSQRDVLNRPGKPEKVRWILSIFERYFDLAIVHGDPKVITLEQSFPDVAPFAARLRYSGYVVQPSASSSGGAAAGLGDGVGAGEVLVSIGGGAVGAPLVAAALAARPLSRAADAPWRFLLGHNLPEEDFRRFQAAAGDGVIVERARPDFPARLANCRLSISQAGYNTVMEILSAGAAAVVVPFAAGSETEQSLRANLLAERGLLTLLAEAALTPENLAQAVDDSLARRLEGRAPRPQLDLDGAAKTATILQEIMASEAGAPS
ncbi:MAG TPA: glycosyltransferase [Kiloniellaceae bacterium]|nr:glycosyltransferase [Kiloniellaceae bacterium]